MAEEPEEEDDDAFTISTLHHSYCATKTEESFVSRPRGAVPVILLVGGPARPIRVSIKWKISLGVANMQYRHVETQLRKGFRPN